MHIGENAFWPTPELRDEFGNVPDHLVQCSEYGFLHGARVAAHVSNLCQGRNMEVQHSGYERVLPIVRSLEGYSPALVLQQDLVAERNPGYCHDMTRREMDEAFPWLAGHWKINGRFFAVPFGGESLFQVCTRARLFLEVVKSSSFDRVVVVVTHKNFIYCTRRVIEGWTNRDVSWPSGQTAKNGSLTIYERDLSTESGFKFLEYQDVD